MSLRVGLGASQADLDVQGEIDFDFFEENDSSIASVQITKQSLTSAEPNSFHSSHIDEEIKNENTQEDEIESFSGSHFKKPLITISCDNNTGTVQKTTIETVIPTPYNYKENKCGKMNSNKKLHSPHLYHKLLKSENVSDDSSISSMSESESEVSSISPDSFELDEESDSMTDVSPLASPYECSTPNRDDKLMADVPCLSNSPKGKNMKLMAAGMCEKCEAIDFKELISAMKQLKMKQNGTTLCSLRCKSPIVTQNKRTRKNLSFTNAEVQKIDNDNKVLLKKILTQQNRANSSGNPNVTLRSSSAVNRQKQQRQIELENLAILKRLEAAKASRNLSRSQLLRDYETRSSGLMSRPSSRSSYPSCSSQHTNRTSTHSSVCSSALKKSSAPSVVKKFSP